MSWYLGLSSFCSFSFWAGFPMPDFDIHVCFSLSVRACVREIEWEGGREREGGREGEGGREREGGREEEIERDRERERERETHSLI